MKWKFDFILPCLVASVIFLTGATAHAPAPLFPTQFYKVLAAAQQDRNFTFSPYSISQAFQLALLGARGETRKEIEVAVEPMPELSDTTPGDEKSASKVVVANRIWLQKGAPIENSYLEESKAKLKATPGLVDFVHHPDLATATINKWVAGQTEGKIQNLIPPSTLNDRSRVVLTNAIYFKAPWEHPFIPGDSFDDDFILTSGRKARVPFMHEHKHLYYADDGRVQVLQLPYAGYRYAMMLVLPREGKTLGEIEQSLSPAMLTGWEQQLKSADVRVALPRFRFDSSFLLNDALKKLGVHRAFVSGEADFSGIDGSKDLYIAQVFHKAYLSVDEAGTEAAAATAIHMGALAMQEPAKPKEFTANHPFLFLIEDMTSKTILFIGRLNNPRG